MAQRVREPLALVRALDLHAMQVRLALEERDGIRHAIDHDVGAAVALDVAVRRAGGRLQPHDRDAVAADARVRVPEETVTPPEPVAARLARQRSRETAQQQRAKNTRPD